MRWWSRTVRKLVIVVSCPPCCVAAHGDPDRIVLRLNAVAGLCEAIEAGIGIGLLPCQGAEARPALRRLRPPVPAPSDGLWLLTHPDLRHSIRVRAFMDFVGEALVASRPALHGRGLGEAEPAVSRPGSP